MKPRLIAIFLLIVFLPMAVLKAEVRLEEFDYSGERTSFWLQLAFVFDATSGRQSSWGSTPASGGAR